MYWINDNKYNPLEVCQDGTDVHRPSASENFIQSIEITECGRIQPSGLQAVDAHHEERDIYHPDDGGVDVHDPDESEKHSATFGRGIPRVRLAETLITVCNIECVGVSNDSLSKQCYLQYDVCSEKQ
jgi:hypothetical protein